MSENVPTPRSPLDEWLVIRCQLGERDAFDALIARWHPPLWRYVTRVTGSADAAADVVQDVWLRVIRGLTRLRDAARFRPWLFGIARRVLMDRLRVRYQQPMIEPLEDTQIEDAPADPDRFEDVERLEAGLSQLPIAEREVLALFYLQELSLADIAEIAAIPVGTVKSRLFRAKRLLRRQLDAGGEPS